MKRKSAGVFTFVIRAKTETATGEATVGEGRVRRLAIKSGDLDYVYAYEYKEVAPITPPPDDRVVPARTSGPTCPPEGEPPPEFVCIDGSGPPTGRE